MLFHRLKHRCLFTIPLTNFAALEKGADFFFFETSTNIPHSALKGATPEEAITGKWTDEKIAELKAPVLTARQQPEEWAGSKGPGMTRELLEDPSAVERIFSGRPINGAETAPGEKASNIQKE